MPVLPEVASRISLPFTSWPDAMPSWIIRSAGRSFTDPPGFFHSAFAYSSTPGRSRSMLRRRISGVSPTRSTIEGLTPAVNVGIAMSDYKGPTLTYSSMRETRLHHRAPSSHEGRPEAQPDHQAHWSLRAARRCTKGSVRNAVHVDRVTATVDQGGGDDLPPLRGSVPARAQADPRACDDAGRRRDTRLRFQPAEGVVHQGPGG